MPQKLDFDNTIKKVENISDKVNIIMRNRLIIAFFLIVDGITFMLNPDTTLSGMAQNIILLILFASISVLIANLAAKTKDVKTIIISLVVIIASIIMYIYPDFIASYMQLLLALFIIYNGTVNIAKALHLNKLSKFTKTIAKKYDKFAHRKAKNQAKQARREKFKAVDDNINEGLEEQRAKMVTPLVNILNKTRKSSTLYIIANAVSIILGIILLIFPDVSMMMWGIIFLYTGLPNLFAAIKTMHLSKKIKEKRFKEILFDAEKPDKSAQHHSNTTQS